MMFGDVVMLSMKEEGHQWGGCTLWQQWAEIDSGHICHCWGNSWWLHHPPAHFTTSDPFVDGKWRLWGLQLWQAMMNSLNNCNFGGCNDEAGEASTEGVDLEAQGSIPRGWGHPIRYETLLWCVEKGFVPFEGRMLGGWRLPFESGGTKKKWSTTPHGGCWPVFPFLWSKIRARRPSRYRWKADDEIFYFIHSKAYYSYVVYTFLINKSKIKVWHLKKPEA